MKLSYTHSEPDYSVFIKNHGQIINLVAIYVDNLLLFSNDEREIAKTKEELSCEYEMKDLGNACWFLGMEITHDHNAHTLALSQCQYITMILTRFSMENVKPVVSPLASGLRLECLESSTVDTALY